MFDAGMYSPVILPTVPDSTAVNPSTTARAQRHALTHKQDRHENSILSEVVACVFTYLSFNDTVIVYSENT